jgi:hypothetical protein
MKCRAAADRVVLICDKSAEEKPDFGQLCEMPTFFAQFLSFATVHFFSIRHGIPKKDGLWFGSLRFDEIASPVRNDMMNANPFPINLCRGSGALRDCFPRKGRRGGF